MIAIHYSSINLSGSQKEIFGIQVAISNWIKAYFRYGSTEKFNFLIGEKKDWEEIQQMADEAGIDQNRLVALDRRYARENFSQFDTIFRPDPHVQNLLWQRQQVAGTGFNFCGLAHAIGGVETGELLERYCLSPSENTDAIVCPSHAVRGAIRSFWDVYGEFLQQRFGTNFKCPVQLPVIPLGIDIDKFEKLATADKRAAQRKKLGVSEDETVLLWVGRLSHAIKAHPIAMFQAAERAAIETGAKVHLVMVGYFVPPEAEPQYRKLAATICKTAKVTFVSHGDENYPDGLWAAGDIFLSLIDNMQESFGLTPIEAMAAGLPRVISDWDGYRDSVKHGEDGFLVRTLQPPPGTGRELSELLLENKEIYGGFLAKTALCVTVDQDKATEAIVALIKNPELRKNFAAKARTKVRATYDWKYIIPAYEALWSEMSAKRKATHQQTKPVNWPVAFPQVPDPFTMYASYPTAALNENNRLTVVATADVIKELWSFEINVFSLDMMIKPEEATQLINHISGKGNVTIAEAFNQFPGLNRNQLWRTIGWLAKLGILRIQ